MMGILRNKVNSTYYTGKIDQINRLKVRIAKNRLTIVGILMTSTVVFIALFPEQIAPYPGAGSEHNLQNSFQPPNLEHPMGTDSMGRDILSRVILGARLALMLSVLVISIAVIIGIIIGLVSGFYGGYIDSVLMRLTDIFLSLPPIVLALAIAAVLPATIWHIMIAISLSWWTWYARLVRGEVISLKEESYIEASKAMGASDIRVMFIEIMPNILTPLTVKVTLDLGNVILLGAALAFLGLGSSPPTPDWGLMIGQGRTYVVSAWWIATFPGLAISWTVLGFNFIGDGLRDIMDVEV